MLLTSFSSKCINSADSRTSDSALSFNHLHHFPHNCLDLLLIPRLLVCGWLWALGFSHFSFVSFFKTTMFKRLFVAIDGLLFWIFVFCSQWGTSTLTSPQLVAASVQIGRFWPMHLISQSTVALNRFSLDVSKLIGLKKKWFEKTDYFQTYISWTPQM